MLAVLCEPVSDRSSLLSGNLRGIFATCGDIAAIMCLANLDFQSVNDRIPYDAEQRVVSMRRGRNAVAWQLPCGAPCQMIDPPTGEPVSRTGDVWIMNRHRVCRVS